MAEILDFRPTTGRTGKSGATAAKVATGEVVIFPGVRYERWESAPSVKPASRTKSRRKRDMLELND